MGEAAPVQEHRYRSFRTTDELYQTVDIYILSLTDHPEDSLASQTYGYPIGTWDVSQISDFSQVFDSERNNTFDLPLPSCPEDCNSTFNEDLSGWNVSAAETMFGMFARTTSFNQDISSWNVTSVRDMVEMFFDAESYNQDISSWNISQVVNMSSMFSLAESFNQNLCFWELQVDPSLANFEDMFLHSDCAEQESPISSNLFWCHRCLST